MSDSEKEEKMVVHEEAKCFLCKQIKWITFETPQKIHRFLYSRRNLFIALLVALFSYAVTFSLPENMRRTVATFVFAAVCWTLEVFPLSITGLMIPVVLTLLGVFSPKDAFAPFSHSIIFLMIGGLVLGQSIRKHGLDKWIGYYLLTLSKGRVDRLNLLVMSVTAFLSMWMSNTVAIAVILPVILSILNSIPEDLVSFRRRMLLGVSVSTSIGGMAMLTGSTPAMMAAALLGEVNLPFGFIQWAYYGLPVSLISLVIAFLILKQMYPSSKFTLNLDAIVEQKKQSEQLTGPQKNVILIFSGTILLWFMGSQVEVLLGLPTSVSSAAIVSIMAVLLMFGSNLLDLKDLQSIQWELIFLVGGGILLGEAMIFSGAAGKISSIVASLQGFAPTVFIFILLSLISLLLTNFTSNSATAAILIPIAIDTASVIGMTPVPFVMVVALSAIIAFITPVGVPSTALIYSTGQISKDKLIKAGILIAIPTWLIALVAVLILPIP